MMLLAASLTFVPSNVIFNDEEKGFNLLYEIQRVVGGAKVFEPFMAAYFTHFRFKSLTTDDFKAFLYRWFTQTFGQMMKEKLDEIDWKTWLYGQGMPPVTPKFDTTLAVPAYDLAKRWSDAYSKDLNPIDLPFNASDLKGWFAGQICSTSPPPNTQTLSPTPVTLVLGVFLETLDDLSDPVSARYVAHMDYVYSFTSSKNAEIISRFFIIAMKGKWVKCYNEVAEFLGSVGRMKFVRPGYRELNKVDRELAVKTFKEHEMFYHPICRALIKKDLGLD